MSRNHWNSTLSCTSILKRMSSNYMMLKVFEGKNEKSPSSFVDQKLWSPVCHNQIMSMSRPSNWTENDMENNYCKF